jgi:branched-chain amino acid transport system permease protein
VKLNHLFSARNILIVVLIAIAAIIPINIRDNNYVTLLATNVLLYAVLATAWNIIGGMGGQLDLSAGATWGLALYWHAIAALGYHAPGGMILGDPRHGLAYFVGTLFSLRALKSGLRFRRQQVEVLRVAFTMWEEVGGPTERLLPYYEWSFYHLRFNTYMPFYYILLVMLLLALFVNYWIRRTRLGYSLLALSEDEDAAEVLGVDARGSKIKALLIYAFLAGVVGGIDVCIKGNLSPKAFNGVQSTEVAILGIGAAGDTFDPCWGDFAGQRPRAMSPAGEG